MRASNPPFQPPLRREEGAARAGNARPAAGGTSEEAVGVSGARGPAPSGGAGPSRPTPEDADADGSEAASGDDDPDSDTENDAESDSDLPLAEAFDGRRLNYTDKVRKVVVCAFEEARAGLEEGKREGPVTLELIQELLSTVRRAARAEPAMAKKLPLFHREKEEQLKAKMKSWLVRPPQRGVGRGGGQTAPGQHSRRSKAAALREAREKAEAEAEERMREMAEERERRDAEGRRWCASKRKEVADLLYGGVGRDAAGPRRRAKRIRQIMTGEVIATEQVDLEYCKSYFNGVKALYVEVCSREKTFPVVAPELAKELSTVLSKLRTLLPAQFIDEEVSSSMSENAARGVVLNFLRAESAGAGAGAGAGSSAGAGAGSSAGAGAGAGAERERARKRTVHNLKRQRARAVKTMQTKAHKLRNINRQLTEVNANRVDEIVDACVVVKKDKDVVVMHSNEKLQAAYPAHMATYTQIMSTVRSAVPTSAPARIVGSGAAIRENVVIPPSAG